MIGSCYSQFFCWLSLNKPLLLSLKWWNSPVEIQDYLSVSNLYYYVWRLLVLGSSFIGYYRSLSWSKTHIGLIRHHLMCRIGKDRKNKVFPSGSPCLFTHLHKTRMWMVTILLFILVSQKSFQTNTCWKQKGGLHTARLPPQKSSQFSFKLKGIVLWV